MYVMYILREHIVLIDCYYKRSKRQKLTMARNILYYIRPPTYPWTDKTVKVEAVDCYICFTVENQFSSAW